VKLAQCRPGATVRYYPSKPGRGFIGVVREEPWKLGDGSWVTHLHQMETAYRDGAKTSVHAAWIDMLDLVAEAPESTKT
jgi:hypothetical protein